MNKNFDSAFEYMMVNEGGYSNHPSDKGGATKYGITKATLERWRGHSVSIEDVKTLTLDEAKAIYKAWYWDTNALDGVFSAPIAICIFDIGVVRGVGSAGKYAQQVCNSHGGAQLTLDGVIGPKSVAAINGMDPEIFIRQFAHRVGGGFKAIVDYNPSQAVFLAGWMNRTNRLLTLIPS